MKKERKSIPRHGKQEEGLGYPFRMVFVDVLTLALVLVGFHVFRVGHIPGYWPLEVYLVSLFFSFLALFISGGYGEKSDKLSLEYATVHLSSFLMAFPLLMTSVYAFTAYSESMRPARAVVIPTVFSFALLSLGIRRLTHLKMMRNKGQGYFSVLGRTDDLWAIWHELMEKAKKLNLDFSFYDVENGQTGPLAGVDSPRMQPWTPKSIERSDSNRMGIVMASHIKLLPPVLKKELTQLHLRGARVLTAESFAETVFGKVLLRDVDEEWVLDRELNLMQNENYARLKLLLDRGMAFLLLLLFLPIFLLISLAILLVDGWPIFYIQKRCGLRSSAFDVFKFRTMKNRKEEGSHYTGEKDDRVTLLGRILRPLRMDELPQLWNILVGDMSLIGPRAEWVKLVEKYETEIPFYHLRHEVPPGLTGWAQVNYPYGSNLEDTREKLRYDLYYIRNHSFLLDFQIVLKTIYVVLAKVGGK